MIPFNKPWLTGKEEHYISEALANLKFSGGGALTRKAEHLLEAMHQSPRVLLTTSCTHALEMSALLLDLQKGDQVLLPSYTFVSTANAFLLRGARPVFADIDPKTLNLDPSSIDTQDLTHCKALVPVHYAGVGCDMDAMQSLSQQHDLAIIEDNAHGLGGSYRQKPLGSFGTFSTLSFHETKNISCGEGGALVINDPSYIERAEIIREKGTNRSQFFRGEVDKYTWVDIGSSYPPSEILAAFLLAQLEAFQEIQDKRKRLWDRYHKELNPWCIANHFQQPHIPAHCQQAYHMHYLLLPNQEIRQRLIQHLKDQNIHAVFHYLPLHLSPMGQQWGYQKGDLPHTEDLSKRLLRLPFYNAMTDEEQTRVISAITAFTP